jgi:hypothetical protein
MEFLGTILRGPDGRRCALYLFRSVGGGWGWRYRWLDDDRVAARPALGLAS